MADFVAEYKGNYFSTVVLNFDGTVERFRALRNSAIQASFCND